MKENRKDEVKASAKREIKKQKAWKKVKGVMSAIFWFFVFSFVTSAGIFGGMVFINHVIHFVLH